MIERNEKEEVEIFKAFANACELPFRLDSIKKTYPPNPDIQCEVSGTGLLAFELVQIMDQNYANLLKKNRDTRERLDEHLYNLPNKKKVCFDQLYSNATISLDFQNNCTFCQREKLLQKTIDHLLTLNEKFEGNTSVNISKNKDKDLLIIKISRNHFNRIRFRVNFASFFTDLTIPTISSKLKKTYKSEYPIHLLVHFNLTPMVPEDIRLSSVKDFFKNNKQKFQFEKIWIFDFQNKEIKFVYPLL